MSSNTPKKIRNKNNLLTSSIKQKKKKRSEIRKKTYSEPSDLSPTEMLTSPLSPIQDDTESKLTIEKIKTNDQTNDLQPVIPDQIQDDKTETIESPTDASLIEGRLEEEDGEEGKLEEERTEAIETSHQDLIETPSDLNDIYNPALIFPFSNKPHEPRKKTIVEESKQWESFFDPQHTFGSFQQAIIKQPRHYFYQGKWPLDPEDVIGMIPGQPHFLFPTVPSPTLPNLQHLELMTDDSLERHDSIEILPCPSSSFPKRQNPPAKDRLELLSVIQEKIFDEQWNGVHRPPYTGSRTARIQMQLKEKARKIKREIMVESVEESSVKSRVGSVSSLVSLSDSWEKISFHPAEKVDLENNPVKLDMKRRNRPSFLLFAFGFLIPPLWIVGAFYRPGSTRERTSESRKIDLKWKTYSRNALFGFLLMLVVLVVLVLALKPDMVGFRNSKEEEFESEVHAAFG